MQDMFVAALANPKDDMLRNAECIYVTLGSKWLSTRDSVDDHSRAAQAWILPALPLPIIAKGNNYGCLTTKLTQTKRISHSIPKDPVSWVSNTEKLRLIIVLREVQGKQ